jgi:hypothetical protein
MDISRTKRKAELRMAPTTRAHLMPEISRGEGSASASGSRSYFTSSIPPVHEPIVDKTLQTLIYAQTTTGGFNLNNKLRTLLRSKFRSTTPKIFDAWFDRVSRIGIVHFSSSEILDTAMPIVWIEVKCGISGVMEVGGAESERFS